MNKVIQKPLYIFLLPLFFILHAWMENYVPGLAPTAFWLLLIYISIAAVLTFIFWAVLKNIRKAAFTSFYVLSFQFFFGSLHDVLKKVAGPHFVAVRYTFVIAFAILLLFALIVYLRKTKHSLVYVTVFLNLLLGLFLAIDLVKIISRSSSHRKYTVSDLSKEATKCDTCQKPDIYVIVTDEYAGQQELTDIFSFNNSAFVTELKKREFFHVDESRSNYNSTVYSMASMFSMQYVKLTAKNLVTQRDMMLCRNIINENAVTNFFNQLGYQFYNNSQFDFNNIRKAVTKHYFIPKYLLITAQTFTERFRREAGFNFFSAEKIKEIENIELNNDRKVDSLTRLAVLQKSISPKFVYTHFIRPHHPYYFDQNGNTFKHSGNLSPFEQVKIEYPEYLQYTNKKLLDLIDFIKSNSAKPPIILLLSDHGFRQFPGNPENMRHYWFMNFAAVHLPASNYDGLYNGISPVNLFRILLNKQFGQQFPILKDSTSFILEK